MKTITVIIFLLISNIALAKEIFKNLRNDRLVPENCRTVELSDFSDSIQYFTFGIQGAKKSGFDYEYPITREDAANIWRKAKQELNPAITGYELNKQSDYDIVVEQAKVLDFDLGSEGEVLEILGTQWLYESLEGQNLYVTGSITYQNPKGSTVIGELDFVVADKSTCQIVGVGEAKLNNRLGKAQQQLQRFRSFLANQKKSKTSKHSEDNFTVTN
jgi:hypothetical protein